MVIGEMLGAPREDADQLVDWTNRTTAFEDPRLVADLGEVWRALEEFIPYVNEMVDRARAAPDRRPDDRLHPGRGRRRAPLARRGADVLLPADGRRQRLDPRRLHLRHEEPARGSRADGAGALRAPCRSSRSSRSSCASTRPSPTCAAPRRATPSWPAARSRRATSWRSGTSSGNRDESVFDDPHRFDVRRDPNPHQGFGGGGRHFCLGAGLARLELKLWIEETLRRFPELELDGRVRADQLDLPRISTARSRCALTRP